MRSRKLDNDRSKITGVFLENRLSGLQEEVLFTASPIEVYQEEVLVHNPDQCQWGKRMGHPSND